MSFGRLLILTIVLYQFKITSDSLLPDSLLFTGISAGMLCIAAACKCGCACTNNSSFASTASCHTANTSILPFLVAVCYVCKLMCHFVYLFILEGFSIFRRTILKLTIVLRLATFMEKPIIVRGSFPVQTSWHIPQMALHG